MSKNVMQNKVEIREKLILKVDQPFNVILQKKFIKIQLCLSIRNSQLFRVIPSSLVTFHFKHLVMFFLRLGNRRIRSNSWSLQRAQKQLTLAQLIFFS